MTNYELTIAIKLQGGNRYWYNTRNYKTENGEFNDVDFYQLRDKFDDYYDDYRKKELNKILKKASWITFIGLSVIALITGLSLGLKKQGNSMTVDPPKKAAKIKPGIHVKKSVPLSEIEDIAKKTVVDFHILLVIIYF